VDNLFTHGTLQGQAYAATPVLTGQAAKLIVVGADPTVASNYIALAGSDQITISVGGQTITGTLSGLPAGLSYNAANKTWSLNTSLVSGFTALADGTYNVSVTVEAGGVTQVDMGSNELQIQSTPPTLALAPIAVDGRINATESGQALVVTGSTDAQVGATVTLTLGGQNYTAQVQPGNTFSLTVPATDVHHLTDGAQAMQVSVTNRFGATTQLSPSLAVDTQAPGQKADGTDEAIAVPAVVLTEAVNATPGINAAELTDGLQAQVTLPTGSVLGDKLNIAVTAPNGTVRVFSHTVTGTEASNGSATITVTADKLAENGAYTLTATTTDVAGNTSKASAPQSFTLDTQAPGQNVDGTDAAFPAPVLTLAEALNGVNQTELDDGLQYQVTLPSGSKAGDTLSFSFKAPDNTVRTSSYTVSANEAAAGSINLTLPGALVYEDGTYTVTVTSTDLAGNLGTNATQIGTTTFGVNAAISTLQGTAQANNATPTTPDATVYTKAGISGVDSTNLAAINSALNSTSVDGTAANTVAKVQAVVDAYTAILSESNGASADASTTDPTQAQYAAIGVTGVDTDAKAALLGEVIGAKVSGDVDSVAEVQTLADAVAATVAYTAAQGQTAPTASQINSLTGGTGAAHTVTTDNLNAVLAAIAAGNTDGTPIASETELQGLIDTAIAGYTTALSALSTFAQANTTGLTHAPAGTAPALGDYVSAGISGVGVNNLHAINDALASLAVDSSQADSAAKVQAIVNAYNAVLSEANGNLVDANPASNPTPASYALIGAVIGDAATDTENLALLNNIVGAQTTAGVDTIAEINTLARIANAIQATAAGGSPNPALTPADLALIGLSGVTSDRHRVGRPKQQRHRHQPHHGAIRRLGCDRYECPKSGGHQQRPQRCRHHRCTGQYTSQSANHHRCVQRHFGHRRRRAGQCGRPHRHAIHHHRCQWCGHV
jgi:hypothetical protein